jgi:hypothetical protein
MSQDLQFEKAEYSDAASATACAGCQGTLADSYYALGDQILCRGCAERLRAELADQGSPAARLGRALGAGLGAAVVGTLIYYGVLAITGYEFGLIAIAVGYGVGLAVRWGARRRGGWAYQALAMGLTYLSIVSAYIPPIIQEIRKANVERPAAGTAADQTPANAVAVVDAAAKTPASQEPDEPTSAGQMFVAVAFLFLLACAAPFLAGAENIIGLVIIGVGLYEAWKLNRRVSFEISGPHPVSAAPSPAA